MYIDVCCSAIATVVARCCCGSGCYQRCVGGFAIGNDYVKNDCVGISVAGRRYGVSVWRKSVGQ